MAQGQLPAEYLYRIGDEVVIKDLQSKKTWNDKVGIIKSVYHPKKQRWAVEVDIPGKPQAYLKANNLQMKKRGNAWVIDHKSDIQRLNMFMKAYIRDLEAFSKLTSRQKQIFDPQFTYHMHDGIMIKGLKEFDKQLNNLKETIMKLMKENNEKIPPFLIDRTQVETMNENMTHFEIIVAIDIGNNKWFQRITELRLNEKSKLVYYARVKSVKIIDQSEFNKTDLQKNEDINNIKKIINENLKIKDDNSDNDNNDNNDNNENDKKVIENEKDEDKIEHDNGVNSVNDCDNKNGDKMKQL